MQTHLPHRRRHHGATGNGLLSGLLHWWDGSETSGNMVASVGSNLTAVGSPAYVSDAPDGGNAREFTGSGGPYFTGSGIFTAADHPAGMTLAIWARAAFDGTVDYLISHPAPNGATTFYFSSGNAATFILDGGITASNAGSAGWVSYVFTSTVSDGSAGADEMWVNGVAATTGVKTRGFEAGTATFYLGVFSGLQSASRWGGDVCSMGVWDYPFSAADVAAFHNSGVNLRYSDLT